MFDCLTCNWAPHNKVLLARAGVLFVAALSIGLSWVIGRFRESCFGKIQVTNLTGDWLVFLEYLWVCMSGPIFAIYFITLLVWPPWVRTELPVRPWLAEVTADRFKAAWKLHLRIVTRGNNPKLVATNCQELQEVCSSIGLHPEQYVIEVVTDIHVNFVQLANMSLDEIVVPDEYRCKNESKWKSRALHYALENVVASPDDWIVHLDEETKVDERCFTAIWSHIVQEKRAVAKGERRYPDLGQGAMLYGCEKHGKIENLITTLADSLRVCDDFGSFRAAFEMRNKFTFGMKGSFVVASQVVEELVSWDHGPSLSLTEDATFNMVALKEHKIGTAWIDAFMYEQSPFSMKDFAKQRQRWYVGLWMCLMSSKTRSKHMMVMPIKMVFWTSQLVVIFLHLCVLLTDVMPIHLEMCLFIYLCGFSITFSPQDGLRRWLGLGCLQVLLIPFFIAMEFMGVLGGFIEIVTRNAGTNFHIVKKENTYNVQFLFQRPDDEKKIPLLAADAYDVKKVPLITADADDVEKGPLAMPCIVPVADKAALKRLPLAMVKILPVAHKSGSHADSSTPSDSSDERLPVAKAGSSTPSESSDERLDVANESGNQSSTADSGSTASECSGPRLPFGCESGKILNADVSTPSGSDDEGLPVAFESGNPILAADMSSPSESSDDRLPVACESGKSISIAGSYTPSESSDDILITTP